MKFVHTPELLARAEAWLARPERERRLTREALDELLAIYNAITGQGRTWCARCEYSDFFRPVADYVRQSHNLLSPATMATSSKYQIAPGFENETFVHESMSGVVTADNLTDESAEFLRKHGFEKQIILKPTAKAADKAKDEAPKTSKKAKAPAKEEAAPQDEAPAEEQEAADDEAPAKEAAAA